MGDRLTLRRQPEGVFWGDGTVLGLVCGGGYMTHALVKTHRNVYPEEWVLLHVS